MFEPLLLIILVSLPSLVQENVVALLPLSFLALNLRLAMMPDPVLV